MVTYSIKDLNRLFSTNSAVKLFDLKISPTASYGIEIIWPHLTNTDFVNLERVKTRYFKKVLGISKYNRSRYVYELIAKDSNLYVTDLKVRFNLPETDVYIKFCEEKKTNRLLICSEFFETETMINDNWRGPDFPDRHIFARFACHGYHYIFCNNATFHYEPNYDCRCKFCGETCEKYHIQKCTARKLTLREAAKMCKN